jgi:hypothetical protein
LADLATAAHLSTSALIKAAPCAGVSENGSLPRFLRPVDRDRVQLDKKFRQLHSADFEHFMLR